MAIRVRQPPASFPAKQAMLFAPMRDKGTGKVQVVADVLLVVFLS